jgi:hypothetical protein
MLKYIFWGLVIYFLVRFVVNFLIPVVRAGRQMREQVKDFQDKMNQQTQFQGNAGTGSQAPKQENRAKAGDYIDFEEIKQT